MTPRFVQLHFLTSYSAALLNRDDAGFAKRMPFGGSTRTRISSQCQKRHWRQFEGQHSLKELDVPGSVRSRLSFERFVLKPLMEGGVAEPLATAVTTAVMNALLGTSEKKDAAADNKKPKKGAKAAEGTESAAPAAAPAVPAAEGVRTSQVTVLGEAELRYALQLCREVCQAETDPKKAAGAVKDRLGKEGKKNLEALRNAAGLDAALFGRMVTGDMLARGDAAVHVAHAMTVHAEHSETDYFTAVDDLLKDEAEAKLGSGHINTQELTSGLFYGYVVVDVPLLVSNLEGCKAKDWQSADRTLAARVVEHFAQLIATVSPGAKLGSTAPYSRSHLVLAETGDEQPRTLANAFLKAVNPQPDLMANTYLALGRHVSELDHMYGTHAQRQLAALGDTAGLRDALRVKEAQSLSGLAKWVGEQVRSA